MTKDLMEWIAQLANPDARERERAAREIFRQGCATAEPVFGAWFADRDFRALLNPGNTLLTVGLAVTPERFTTIRNTFGITRLAAVPPDQDALEFGLTFPQGVRLDILTPAHPDGEGALAKFLRRFGEGIQQVECDVRDLARATEILRTRFQLEPIYPDKRSGADGTEVNFFLAPRDTVSKVLIELVETSARKKHD